MEVLSEMLVIGLQIESSFVIESDDSWIVFKRN